MRFDEDDLAAMLEERGTATTRTQMVGWAAGALERIFSIRLAEIETAISAVDGARSDWVASMTVSRPVSGRVRQRLSDAVDRYFDDLEASVRQVAVGDDEDELFEPDEAVPHEQILILTNLLIGVERADELAMTLTSQIQSASELEVVEQLLGERLTATRSSVVNGARLGSFTPSSRLPGRSRCSSCGAVTVRNSSTA